MKKIIFADNAATTQLDPEAFEAMIPWMRDEYGNASQPYSFSRKPKKAIAEARAVIAECINADPEEIYFTSGGTESDNWAIKGSAFSDSDHCVTITSQIEHHAVLRSCAAIERLGYPVAYLPADEEGCILPEILSRYISDRTRLVSVMTANNEIGTIQDIAGLSEIAHAHGSVFHTDAVQAVGHIPIDVKALDVNMLSASAHKFNGPRGIGFLYIRKGIKVRPFMDGGGQENKNRAGTENTAAIVGMSIALMNNTQNMRNTSNSIRSLENLLITKLIEEGLVFRRNGANTLPGLISLSFQNSNGEMLLHRMDLKGICVSTGSAPFYLSKLFAPYFNPGGSIINISSSRDRMSQPQTESYTAAKGGIAALTHALAVSLAGKVRVNSISPGWIDTSYKIYNGADAIQQPCGRVGTPLDIANMVLFLCSDKAGFITGENICIDGGMTKLMIYHGDHGWSLDV